MGRTAGWEIKKKIPGQFYPTRGSPGFFLSTIQNTRASPNVKVQSIMTNENRGKGTDDLLGRVLFLVGRGDGQLFSEFLRNLDRQGRLVAALLQQTLTTNERRVVEGAANRFLARGRVSKTEEAYLRLILEEKEGGHNERGQ